MKINSTVFVHQGTIPDAYTCEGQDISPALVWEDVPEEAKSFALIVDDPDAPAGTWVHWLIYNIPANEKILPSGVSNTENLPDGARQGRNSSNNIGYKGPCPPPGHGPHRYFFRFYALDSMLGLPAGANRKDLEEAMKGHILNQTEMMGRYERKY